MLLLDIRHRIETLRKEIERHNELYYQQARPEISDFEYDRLMQELIQLETRHPEFLTPDSPSQRVGGAPIEGFKTIEHRVPMYSIDNTYNEGELYAWAERVRKQLGGSVQVAYVCEPKVDGVALSIRYENGLFKYAVTRGDGRRGDDVSANVKTIREVPLRLRAPSPNDLSPTPPADSDSLFTQTSGDRFSKWPEVLEVRGEVYMNNADFLKINQKQRESGLETYANPRNFTAGTLKQLDPRIVRTRPLKFVAHGLGEVIPPLGDSYYQVMQVIHQWGIPISPEIKRFESITEVAEWIRIFSEKRSSLAYNTDGMVVKIDSQQQRDQLGYTSKSPRWVIAYKYPAEQVQTILKQVTWQVGKNGTLTPVAELEPVFVAGTTVKRASLHNIEQIQRLGLHLGDIVTVEKAGEIIPQVVGVDADRRKPDAQPILPPAHCPSCGAEVEKESDGPYIRCENPSCPAQLKERLRHFAARGQMNIEGLGEALIDQLVDTGKVKSFVDLFRITKEDLLTLERMGSKSADNVIASIQAAKSRPLDRLLAGLGIRHVGTTVARLLARSLGSLDALSAATVEQLGSIQGVGPIIAQAVYDFLNSPAGQQVINDLKSVGIDPKQTVDASEDNQILAGQSVVVTGTLQHFDRKQIEDLIVSLGGKASGSVSRNTSFVVAGESAGSKLDKARSLGIPVLTEQEFLKKIGRL